ncbi:hypothetical protein RDI58_028732 [Solanum bulbocastanum]|uniref:Uncharacterized protein n=1 Tax=Solanum bulbocastanum TaxID=147425 RepID=A0AAN8SSG1_SOLBU
MQNKAGKQNSDLWRSEFFPDKMNYNKNQPLDVGINKINK